MCFVAVGLAFAGAIVALMAWFHPCATPQNTTEHPRENPRPGTAVASRNDGHGRLQKNNPRPTPTDPLKARIQAIEAVAECSDYGTSSARLSDLVKRVESGESAIELSALERQAVVQVLLRIAEAVKPTFAVAAVRPQALEAAPDSPAGYFRESTRTDGSLMTQATGTLTSRSGGREFSLEILGTVALVGGTWERIGGNKDPALAMKRGGKLLTAARGRVLMSRSSFTNEMVNPTVLGITGSLTISEFDENSLLIETDLPQDRVPMYSPSPEASFVMQPVLPTGHRTVYGIRGTVHDLFPGITVRARDNQIVYLALLRDSGLSYLAGAGDITVGSEKVALPPPRATREGDRKNDLAQPKATAGAPSEATRQHKMIGDLILSPSVIPLAELKTKFDWNGKTQLIRVTDDASLVRERRGDNAVLIMRGMAIGNLTVDGECFFDAEAFHLLEGTARTVSVPADFE